MIKNLGLLWGFLFLLGGILGFVPGITRGDMFLGVFMVNPPHSLMHIASGAIFLAASMFSAKAVRPWFIIIGLFYAALSVMGFVVGNGMIFHLISNNAVDSWGHGLLALVLLLTGITNAKLSWNCGCSRGEGDPNSDPSTISASR